MTIAIALKVNDGVVLAADSAASLGDANGEAVYVYNNANKICNLRKGLPIGIVYWGLGGIGSASISTLMKDLRRRLSGKDAQHSDWELGPTYTIESVAKRVREFLFDEQYAPLYGQSPMASPFGCFVTGYSSGAAIAEIYNVEIAGGSCADPQRMDPPDQPGAFWAGQGEALFRLMVGYSPSLSSLLEPHLQMSKEDIGGALTACSPSLNPQVITAAMPIQDAIDLAEFMADVAIKYSHFTPKAATVGGPIEIAAITKHEGFKWVRRKYYYRRDLNPEVTDA